MRKSTIVLLSGIVLTVLGIVGFSSGFLLWIAVCDEVTLPDGTLSNDCHTPLRQALYYWSNLSLLIIIGPIVLAVGGVIRLDQARKIKNKPKD